MPSSILLSVIILRAFLLNVILQSVILLSVLMLRTFLLNFILPKGILMSVIILRASQCHSAELHSDKCYNA
jgi:hypothetical protein